MTAVMELIHSTRQTGQLRVQAELPGGPLPLRLEFVGGELVGCALHDWHGPEALYAFPQTVTTGRAEFWQMRVSAAARWPLAPFGQLMGSGHGSATSGRVPWKLSSARHSASGGRPRRLTARVELRPAGWRPIRASLCSRSASRWRISTPHT
ncbi:hypothetical protein [Deinococcus radiophilus]|uniref:hypothetical protein n=1 Tax=Deinococcus radiophilus TaxID=32062 RepID=UPI0036107EBA